MHFFTRKMLQGSVPINVVPKKVLSLVFDVDGILTDASEPTCDQEKLYFLRKSAILTYSNRLYPIIPGIIELMRYAYEQPDVEIAFFSAGSKERNEAFVRQLLIIALGQDKYNEIKSTLKIGSRDDLSSDTQDPYKKDIRKVLSIHGQLDYALLIDDNPQYVRNDQVQNHLHCEGSAYSYSRTIGGKNPYSAFSHYYFYKYNSAFFIAGAVSQCLSAFRKGQSVTEELGKMDCNDTRYYKKGRIILQQINPRLSFVTPGDYTAFTEAPPTENEQDRLDKLNIMEQKESAGWCAVL